MSVAVLINSHTDAEGQLQHCLAVPRMAVATSLMELQPDTCSVDTIHDGGVLLGAHHFQAVLTLPLVDNLTGTLYLSGTLPMFPAEISHILHVLTFKQSSLCLIQ